MKYNIGDIVWYEYKEGHSLGYIMGWRPELDPEENHMVIIYNIKWYGHAHNDNVYTGYTIDHLKNFGHQPCFSSYEI